MREILALWQDQWKVIQLPIFKFPAYLDNRPYDGGIESVSMDVFQLTERGEEIAKKHGANRVLLPKYRAQDFARFVAKMAYGYAVERYGLDAFEDVYVVPAILGDRDDIGKWVGCPESREFPIRQCIVSVGYKIIPGGELVVRIKTFAQFDGAEYVVVVGKMKNIYSNYEHSAEFRFRQPRSYNPQF